LFVVVYKSKEILLFYSERNVEMDKMIGKDALLELGNSEEEVVKPFVEDCKRAARGGFDD